MGCLLFALLISLSHLTDEYNHKKEIVKRQHWLLTRIRAHKAWTQLCNMDEAESAKIKVWETIKGHKLTRAQGTEWMLIRYVGTQWINWQWDKRETQTIYTWGWWASDYSWLRKDELITMDGERTGRKSNYQTGRHDNYSQRTIPWTICSA